MKRSELKNILKPLIKECIKEVIFEEGVLSGLINEVVQGLGTSQMLTERSDYSSTQLETSIVEEPRQLLERDPEFVRSLEENKRRLEASLGSQFKGVLEETQPLSRGGAVNESKAQSPLATYAPNDAGVDISGLMQLGGGKNWKHMI
tara:strand:+ start:380 stop:820 length:441 start_codon:yes stop_codon:yes gene_type:complete